ncbi:hypothetical protein [Brevundimonas sp. SL130]|uniref:hypothetical protein n=1 Tax=Brevundimonas sp. SL130 TaxID=2995143 RepID=UPI00226CBFEB|nr:hypothetical protein [Brevundimonas sp. SL130]WAC58724.1 hypothetical protein OU998_10895 [Brevundimonas sp. SL130]
MKILSIAVGLALLAGGSAVAQTEPSPPPTQRGMIDHLINSPFVRNWNTWGLAAQPTPHAAEGVTGREALTIDVQRAGDPWSVGAVMTNSGAIKTGDVVLLGVWVRAVRLPEGQSETRVPIVLLEGQGEPKITLAQATNLVVRDEWRMLYASGVATADIAPGQSSIIIQMGQARHRLELGPALVFNFGPDYDRSQLPQNPTD